MSPASIMSTIFRNTSLISACSLSLSSARRSEKVSCSGGGIFATCARPGRVSAITTLRLSSGLRSRVISWRFSSRSTMPVMVAGESDTAFASAPGLMAPCFSSSRTQTSCGPVN